MIILTFLQRRPSTTLAATQTWRPATQIFQVQLELFFLLFCSDGSEGIFSFRLHWIIRLCHLRATAKSDGKTFCLVYPQFASITWDDLGKYVASLVNAQTWTLNKLANVCLRWPTERDRRLIRAINEWSNGIFFIYRRFIPSSPLSLSLSFLSRECQRLLLLPPAPPFISTCLSSRNKWTYLLRIEKQQQRNNYTHTYSDPSSSVIIWGGNVEGRSEQALLLLPRRRPWSPTQKSSLFRRRPDLIVFFFVGLSFSSFCLVENEPQVT